MATAFNEMIDRLEDGFRRLSSFSGIIVGPEFSSFKKHTPKSPHARAFIVRFVKATSR